MADHTHIFPIKKMSQVLGVSRSGYYKWLRGKPSRRAIENHHLKKAIARCWKKSKKKYGSPRIHRQLLAEGWKVSRPRVARKMVEMGISSQIRRKWIKTTDSGHGLPIAGNVLARGFFPQQLNQVWVSDITYIPSQEGWLYLTTVMDLADRQIVGWALSQRMSATDTSVAALRQAMANRGCPQELLFHSDRGVQYACEEFTTLLKTHRITQSMSRKGNCWDNAPAESFFKTLKHEMDISQPFNTYQQARNTIFEFIEIWYNRNRLHSAIGYLTPQQAEQKLKHKLAA